MALKIFILVSLNILCALSARVPTAVFHPPQSNVSGFIVGGVDAEADEAPYQCSFQVNRRHVCGCAIIASEWIVTAAHCIQVGSTQSVEILVGTNDLSTGGTYYSVDKLISHPEFNRPRFAHDIGLALIIGEIQLSRSIQAIDLSPDEVPVGSTLKLTGWGRLSAGGPIPQRLQVIELQSIGNAECGKLMASANVDLHDSTLCTLSPVGIGICNGDSGGPLVLDGKLVGIVNFAVPCAVGMPDGFAKLSYLYQWVQDNKH